MSLELDERRIAILAELGIRHVPFAPSLLLSLPVAAPEPVPVTVAPVRAAPAVREAQAPLAVAQPSHGEASAVEAMQWEELAEAAAQCRGCNLCDGRRGALLGAGDPSADWLIVAEPPDEAEDLAGEPFVGDAGRLLDNMLRAMGLARNRNVYITNVLKCRPPGSRNPEPGEVEQCERFLRRQVALLQPRMIIAMGRFAVQSLLGSTEAVGKLRGRCHAYMGVPVVVTLHPANLLRNPADKAKAWADLCFALDVVRAQPA